MTNPQTQSSFLVRIIYDVDKKLAKTINKNESIILLDRNQERLSEKISGSVNSLNHIAKKDNLNLKDSIAFIYKDESNTQKYGGRFEISGDSYQVALRYDYKIEKPRTLLNNTRFESINDKKAFMRHFVDSKVLRPAIKKCLSSLVVDSYLSDVSSIDLYEFAKKILEETKMTFMSIGMKIESIDVEHIKKP